MDMQDMSELIEDIDSRTRAAGTSAMELLLFSLGTPEVFGMNVFKVREITRTPAIARAPNLPHGVTGLVSLRGSIIPVVSLAKLLGTPEDGCSNSTMMVAEFSHHVQGVLLHAVQRIVRVPWDQVHAPNAMLADSKGYVSSLTTLPDGTLVSILDVEHALAGIYGEAEIPDLEPLRVPDASVFFADDSAIARRDMVRVLDKLGVRHQHAANGREAWDRLQAFAARAEADGEALVRRLSAIVLDAEMPEMDGYVLTRSLKADRRFAGIPILMHSSLSSEASRSMGAKAGVDAYIAKFDPRLLAETLRPMIVQAAKAAASPEIHP